jgi:uncharacterized protein
MSRIVRVVVVFIGVALSSSLFAHTTVYEISKGRYKLYLAGTIHLLRPQDLPAPAEFDAVYKLSQKIVFETDIEKAESPEFGERFAQAMMIPNNGTLKDVLDADTWAALQTFSVKAQYPLNQTMMFNPAMTSMLITIAESKKMGVSDGIDVLYSKAARNDNKITGELESGDDVIAYMGSFAQEDPNKMITSTLRDVENLKTDFEKMIDAWKRGDLDSLQKDMGDKLQIETPNIYKGLIVERNTKWLPQLEEMLRTPEIEMVLVGSLHLSGAQGLLAQLKKAGYTVKPYQIAK